MKQNPQQALQDLLIEYNANPPLDEAMACIAIDEDETVDFDDILNQLDKIAEEIHLPNVNDTIDSVSRINDHLFSKMGFKGNHKDYHNPDNSLIHKVLERRTGNPITLSSLYIEIARRLNFEVIGIGFPYHFILRPKNCGSTPFFIDPFQKGAILLKDDLQILLCKYGVDSSIEQTTKPSSTREIIQRMSNNLFFSHRKAKDDVGVLRNLERLILITPECADLLRVRSTVLASMGDVKQAISSLKEYLHATSITDRMECEQRLKLLKQLSTAPSV